MKISLITTSLFIAVGLTGCATKDDPGAERFLTEKEQDEALSQLKLPQRYNFNVYPVQGGIAFSGTARLHPNQIAITEFLKTDTPAVKIRGTSRSTNCNALLDTSSPATWMEFTTAMDFKAKFLGMNEKAIPYRGASSEGVNAYAAVIPHMRIDHLFIENAPVYVRMSEGSLGPMARGVYDPKPTLSLGYDLLRLFETVQINLKEDTVKISATHPYKPNENLLMSETRILDRNGYGLVVEGAISGKPTPVVLDLMGNYYFMRGDSKSPQTKQVSLGDVVYRKVPTTPLPVPNALPRAGRRMLDNYIITICPARRVVYFERYPK